MRERGNEEASALGAPGGCGGAQGGGSVGLRGGSLSDEKRSERRIAGGGLDELFVEGVGHGVGKSRGGHVDHSAMRAMVAVVACGQARGGKAARLLREWGAEGGPDGHA